MSSIFLNFKYNSLFKYKNIRKLEIMYGKFFKKNPEPQLYYGSGGY
jgi:hypothetical protein